MPGHSTTNVMLIHCQIQEKHLIKKKIYFPFVDLVPCFILWWANEEVEN